MAGTTITDSGASISVTVAGQTPRNIMKAQIIEITVIKTNIIKIDIGQGALGNLFIPYTDVTNPSTASPGALKDAINALLTPASSGGNTVGGATEARQIDQSNLLTQLNTISTAIQGLITSLDNKVFYQPLLVDDGGAGIVYKGYAAVGTLQEQPTWAIERIQKVGDVDVHTWVNGQRTFVNSWVNRETFTYQ
ncbi:MAG: hypothetical protein ACXVP0_12795 [Bacteroidia bacterium]